MVHPRFSLFVLSFVVLRANIGLALAQSVPELKVHGS